MNIFNNTIKFNKILLPRLQAKSLKPLASLISPKSILITMLLISILSQITDNLKSILSLKDIQKLPSVKTYIKAISLGISSLSLSAIFSLSKTLGPELEILSVLNPTERLIFLREIQKKIINDRGPGKICSKYYTTSDSLKLARHRKGISMQYRSLLVSTSIFASNSIVQGISVKQINLDNVIYSSKLFWISMGLEEHDFEFLIKKEALVLFNSRCFPFFVKEPKTLRDALIIILYSEFKSIFDFKENLVFDEDETVLVNDDNNLVLLEKELGFISRLYPSFVEEFSIPKIEMADSLVRMSLDQRKSQGMKLSNILKNEF
uniref:Maturase n=1 Tax=Monomorphina parapyrum TaxID=1664066 RepID=A0A0G3VID1_9EUGL|nr:maturase [Monomorphina parapyrum]AKL78911.1 maturase [Monomorphina parapyrum]